MEKQSLREIAHKDDVPDWMVDNHFLFSGYRKGFNCLGSSLRSLFWKHNETMNVWTHLLAAIAFITLLGYLIVNFEQNKIIYSEIKNELNFRNFSEMLQESSDKIIQVFNEINLEENLRTFKTNIEAIQKIQIDFLQEAKEKLIKQELSFILTFNSQMDKLKHQAEHYFSEYIDHYRDFKDHGSESFKDWLENFEEVVSGKQVIDAVNRILNSELEFYPIILFFVSAITCLGFSAIFHLFYVINPRVCKILQKLDYAGISILIFGSAFNIYFYYFYCEPTISSIYCTAIGVACLAVFFISLSDWIDRPEAVRFKGLMYGFLGLSNALPITHMVYLNWTSQSDPSQIPLDEIIVWILIEALFYLGGLAIYVFRFPERYFPKTFDIWLNSHTVWHLCVVGGTLGHLMSTLKLYSLRNEHHCF